MDNSAAASTMASLGNFKYEPANISRKKFITDGCFYKMLSVDVDAGQADMLAKFEAGGECLHHRHAAIVSTLVLQGELRVR